MILDKIDRIHCNKSYLRSVLTPFEFSLAEKLFVSTKNPDVLRLRLLPPPKPQLHYTRDESGNPILYFATQSDEYAMYVRFLWDMLFWQLCPFSGTKPEFTDYLPGTWRPVVTDLIYFALLTILKCVLKGVLGIEATPALDSGVPRHTRVSRALDREPTLVNS